MKDKVFNELMASRAAAELFINSAGTELRRRLTDSPYLGVNPEHSVAWRVKTVEAVRAKLRDKDGKGALTVNDFIGIRVLTGHSGCLADAIKEIDIWAERLELLEVRRENRFETPDESGYQAIHLDYEFVHPEKRELTPAAGLEVQLTTWLQHFHSMLAHRLYYKSADRQDASVLGFLRQLSEDLERTDDRIAEFFKAKMQGISGVG